MRAAPITLAAIVWLGCRPPGAATSSVPAKPEPSTSVDASPTEPPATEPTQPPVTLAGASVVLAQELRFDAQHHVHPDSRPILAELARFLRERPELGDVMIASIAYGGADHPASIERASSVVEQLVALGVDRERLDTHPGLSPGDTPRLPDARGSIIINVLGLPEYMNEADCSWWEPVHLVSPHVSVDEHGMLGLDAPIAFEARHTQLPPTSLPILEEVAAFLLANPRFIRVRVEVHLGDDWGHTVSMSPSDRRARSVHDFLVSRGIESRRIHAVGFDDSRPIADPRTPEGRAQNDRVEIFVESVPAYLEPLCDREATPAP